MENQQLSKKEEYERRRAEKIKTKAPAQKSEANKKIFIYFGILLLLAAISFGVYLAAKSSSSSNSDNNNNEIISRNGLHWHSELHIKIFGKEEAIPANVGIGITHQPIHTHESDNIIHMEFSGLVRKNDLKLGRFFEIWKKQFNKDCIFEKCNGDGGNLKMLVNGEPNSEFENYQMKDNDKIEIIFE